MARMPISPSMQGLSRAVAPTGQPWSENTDPLGVGVQSQAQQNHFGGVVHDIDADYGSTAAGDGQSQLLNEAVHQTGPLEDPQWAGFFQAVQNAGGGKPVGFGMPRQKGNNSGFGS